MFISIFYFFVFVFLATDLQMNRGRKSGMPTRDKPEQKNPITKYYIAISLRSCRMKFLFN